MMVYYINGIFLLNIKKKLLNIIKVFRIIILFNNHKYNNIFLILQIQILKRKSINIFLNFLL